MRALLLSLFTLSAAAFPAGALPADDELLGGDEPAVARLSIEDELAIRLDGVSESADAAREPVKGDLDLPVIEIRYPEAARSLEPKRPTAQDGRRLLTWQGRRF